MPSLQPQQQILRPLTMNQRISLARELAGLARQLDPIGTDGSGLDEGIYVNGAWKSGGELMAWGERFKRAKRESAFLGVLAGSVIGFFLCLMLSWAGWL